MATGVTGTAAPHSVCLNVVAAVTASSRRSRESSASRRCQTSSPVIPASAGSTCRPAATGRLIRENNAMTV